MELFSDKKTNNPKMKHNKIKNLIPIGRWRTSWPSSILIQDYQKQIQLAVREVLEFGTLLNTAKSSALTTLSHAATLEVVSEN